MCLAIPGKLITIATDDAGVRMGRANFGGIVKEVCLEYTPDVQCGDYVLVHVGFALGKVDEAEAQRTYDALKSLNQLGDLETPDLESNQLKFTGHPEPAIKSLRSPTNSPGTAEGASP
jgi:hydrogenase expression/formation protein HypC